MRRRANKVLAIALAGALLAGGGAAPLRIPAGVYTNATGGTLTYTPVRAN